MAKPITRTPVLEGKDAEEFLKRARDNFQNDPSPEEAAKITASMDRAFRRFREMKIIYNS